MSEHPAGHHGEPAYGAPYPPAQAYGPAQTYGQPAAYGAPQAYGQPYGAALQPYSPAAAPVPYSPPYPAAYPAGPALVSAGGRLGAVLLDLLLMMVTLWIGWFVWAMITWSDGQTPAKKLLGHVVADVNTGAPFDWGRMALREFCIKGLLGWVLNAVTFGVYSLVDCFMVFGDRQRTLHDRLANSIVRHV